MNLPKEFIIDFRQNTDKIAEETKNHPDSPGDGISKCWRYIKFPFETNQYWMEYTSINDKNLKVIPYLEWKEMQNKKIIGYKLLKNIENVRWDKGDKITESASRDNWCNNGTGYPKSFVNIDNRELFEPIFEEEFKPGDYVTNDDYPKFFGKLLSIEENKFRYSGHNSVGTEVENDWYSLSDMSIRRATKEEIEKYKKENEKIKVGGYDIEFSNDGIRINGEYYTKQQLIDLQQIMKNHSSQIKFLMCGCNATIKFDLNILNKIINKLI